MQRRISNVFAKKQSATPAAAPPVDVKPIINENEGTAPFPPPQDSWKVDEAFLEESSRLVPASPDDVDTVTRAVFVSRVFKGNDWEDLDFVEYGLGVALDIFPHNATFDSLKWVFWTENNLNRKLSSLVQALARPESKCLEFRTKPDFQFRRVDPPL